MNQTLVWGQDTVRAYQDFCHSHTLYEDSSKGLVEFTAQLLADKHSDEHRFKVIDLGCGTGETMKHIVARLPVEHAWGIDASSAMLDVAKKECAESNVDYICGSASQLSTLVEGEVDLVICNASFWLMNMPQVLAEVEKVLKKDGLMCFNIPGYLIMQNKTGVCVSQTPPLISAFKEALNESNGEAKPNTSYTLSESTLMRVANSKKLSLRHQQMISFYESVECSMSSLSIPAIFNAYKGNTDPQYATQVLTDLYQELRNSPPSKIDWNNYALAKV